MSNPISCEKFTQYRHVTRRLSPNPVQGVATHHNPPWCEPFRIKLMPSHETSRGKKSKVKRKARANKTSSCCDVYSDGGSHTTRLAGRRGGHETKDSKPRRPPTTHIVSWAVRDGKGQMTIRKGGFVPQNPSCTRDPMITPQALQEVIPTGGVAGVIGKHKTPPGTIRSEAVAQTDEGGGGLCWVWCGVHTHTL